MFAVCSHIGHKHRGAQSPGLQCMDDVGREVGVVGDGRRDADPTRPHVLPATSLLTSSDALQHTPSVLTIGVLVKGKNRSKLTSDLRKNEAKRDKLKELVRKVLKLLKKKKMSTRLYYLVIFQCTIFLDRMINLFQTMYG